MWPALPVAHLAGVEPADILREESAAEEPGRDQQGEQARLIEARRAFNPWRSKHQREADFLAIWTGAGPSRFSVLIA